MWNYLQQQQTMLAVSVTIVKYKSKILDINWTGYVKTRQYQINIRLTMYEKLKLRRLDCKENQTSVEIEAGETFLGNI